MADSLIYQSEKTLKDNEGKFNEALATEAKEKIETLKTLSSNEQSSAEELKQATEELNQTMMKIWQEIYSSSQSSSQNNQESTASDSTNTWEDYVDAEVEEK